MQILRTPVQHGCTLIGKLTTKARPAINTIRTNISTTPTSRRFSAAGTPTALTVAPINSTASPGSSNDDSGNSDANKFDFKYWGEKVGTLMSGVGGAILMYIWNSLDGQAKDKHDADYQAAVMKNRIKLISSLDLQARECYITGHYLEALDYLSDAVIVCNKLNDNWENSHVKGLLEKKVNKFLRTNGYVADELDGCDYNERVLSVGDFIRHCEAALEYHIAAIRVLSQKYDDAEANVKNSTRCRRGVNRMSDLLKHELRRAQLKLADIRAKRGDKLSADDLYPSNRDKWEKFFQMRFNNNYAWALVVDGIGDTARCSMEDCRKQADSLLGSDMDNHVNAQLAKFKDRTLSWKINIDTREPEDASFDELSDLWTKHMTVIDVLHDLKRMNLEKVERLRHVLRKQLTSRINLVLLNLACDDGPGTTRALSDLSGFLCKSHFELLAAIDSDWVRNQGIMRLQIVSLILLMKNSKSDKAKSLRNAIHVQVKQRDSDWHRLGTAILDVLDNKTVAEATPQRWKSLLPKLCESRAQVSNPDAVVVGLFQDWNRVKHAICKQSSIFDQH